MKKCIMLVLMGVVVLGSTASAGYYDKSWDEREFERRRKVEVGFRKRAIRNHFRFKNVSKQIYSLRGWETTCDRLHHYLERRAKKGLIPMALVHVDRNWPMVLVATKPSYCRKLGMNLSGYGRIPLPDRRCRIVQCDTSALPDND